MEHPIFDVYDGDRSKFEFATVKTVARSACKAITAYEGDVSRILDVCRQTIYFDSVEHLTRCVCVCACACACVCMYLHSRTYVYVCVCVFIYIYICIHIYIHCPF